MNALNNLPAVKSARVIKNAALIIALFFTGIYNGQGQNISIKGYIKDEASTRSVKNAVAMAVRLSDSLLIKFARSDSNGFFKIEKLPVDTYQVVFSHPDFGDKTFIIMTNKNDSVIDFKNISMPIKSLQIAEVTIFGFASPVYFKGDTLVYAADSFKVKPNAVVEDLLKKLPGIRVDKNGKIFAQGQQVDKVLVDGDEFFGSDPTIATKNLPANSVESVQIYDKKNENSNSDSKETEKVMNLKLKENAKKGYFGKVSGAADFNKFYEEQVFLNRFRGKQKISAFSLGSNTLNSRINWEDMNAYGLDNEREMQYSEENDYWYTMNTSTAGIPHTFKNGLYFTDQVFKKTKLSVNYTNTQSSLRTRQEVFSQYLLSDTSYQTKKISEEQKNTETNSVNLSIDQKIDSLTKLTFTSNFKYDAGSRNYSESNQFISKGDELRRETEIENNNKLKKYNVINNLWLYRDFKKKSRKLILNYRYSLNTSNSTGLLNSANKNVPFQAADEINQEKISETGNIEHMAAVTYTEPLNKKIKTEIGYDYTGNKGLQDKKTFDFLNGAYNHLNDSLTNHFENNRQVNRAGLKFIYEVKKESFFVGARVRQVTSESSNKETQQKISQTFNALLPYARFRYNFSDNARFSIGYITSSKQPELNQLQPVADNSNPNFIYIGNPNLRPTYSQSLDMYYNFYKPVNGNYLGTYMKFSTINNNISNSVHYDNLGRSITQPVNVNGNYNGNFNFYYSIPLFSKRLEIGPNIYSSYSNFSNIINGKTNSTKSTSLNGGLSATIHADSSNLEINLEGNFGKTLSKTTVAEFNNNTFITANYSASVSYTITKNWILSSDIAYTYKAQQAKGRNVEYYIWGASVSRKFFKKENLIISIEAYDLLNQNINADQTIVDNVVTYTKSNTVGRYVLLRAVYKFNSNKTSGNDE